MNLEILYEDQDLLAINKPAGLIVNRATSVQEPTVQDWLVSKLGEACFRDEFWLANQSYQQLIPADFETDFGQPLEIWHERLGIVHRLDKDTSGVLLLAKNPGALLNLLAQFKQRQTKKTYLALVHGHLAEKTGHIVAPMSRNPHNRLKFGIDSAGKPAITDYLVQQEFIKIPEELIATIATQSRVKAKKIKELYQDGFSLVVLKPKTGRTHQIRVHMSALHHPLVADQVYTGKKRAKLDTLWCPRQFLQAASLEFTHPRTGEQMKIEAPLANDLQSAIIKLS